MRDNQTLIYFQFCRIGLQNLSKTEVSANGNFSPVTTGFARGTVKINSPLQQGLQRNHLHDNLVIAFIVKINSPLQQGLQHNRNWVCKGLSSSVKINSPLQQGLQQNLVNKEYSIMLKSKSTVHYNKDCDFFFLSSDFFLIVSQNQQSTTTRIATFYIGHT